MLYELESHFDGGSKRGAHRDAELRRNLEITNYTRRILWTSKLSLGITDTNPKVAILVEGTRGRRIGDL